MAFVITAEHMLGNMPDICQISNHLRLFLAK